MAVCGSVLYKSGPREEKVKPEVSSAAALENDLADADCDAILIKMCAVLSSRDRGEFSISACPLKS